MALYLAVAAQSREPREPLVAGLELLQGRFVLKRRLGVGGAGEVWEAWDKFLREVALKFLGSELSRNRDMRELLVQEARTLVGLRADNIVACYGIHEDEDLLFIGMELLRGPSLHEVLVDRREQGQRGLDPDEIIGLLRQIVPALEYAHSQGVTHCDLKPGNLLLDAPPTRTAGNPTARCKIADFGLAHRAKSAAEALGLGGTNPMGTPGFMAPEAFFGMEPSGTSDVFSLAATMYALVTGEPPFVPMAEVVQETWERPAESPLSGNASLDRALLAGLEVQPSRRVRSPSELLELALDSGTSLSLATEPATRVFSPPPSRGARRVVWIFALSGASEVLSQDELRFAAANPSAGPVVIRLELEANGEAAPQFQARDLEVELDPGEVEWIAVRVRGGEIGGYPVSLFVHVRYEDLAGRSRTDSWEQRDALVLELTENGVRPVYPEHLKRATVPADVRQATSALEGMLDERDLAGGASLLQLPLERPKRADAVLAPERSSIRNRHVVMDAFKGPERRKRVHFLFQREVRFGRSPHLPAPARGAARNHLVWCLLPSRSPELDPEHWNANLEISRRAGMISADSRETVLESSSQSLLVDGESLYAGARVPLEVDRRRVLQLGWGPDALALSVLIRGGDDHSLDDQLYGLLSRSVSGTSSGAMIAPTLHRSIVLERINNYRHVQYVAAMPWVSVGGGDSDDCFLEGMPERAVTLAYSSVAYRLLCPEFARMIGEEPNVWIPIAGGASLRLDTWTLRFAASSVFETAEEMAVVMESGQ